MKRLIDETDIRREVADLGRQIRGDFEGRALTVLGVLTGSIVLVADLIRKIDLPIQLGLVQASSYRGRTTRPGPLIVEDSLLPDIEGRDVLLVDDIFDSGRTLSTVCGIVQQRGPRVIRTAVLLWKDVPTDVEITPDYYCFRIPDVYVVGYGLDYNGEHRHLPYIAVMEEADVNRSATG